MALLAWLPLTSNDGNILYAVLVLMIFAALMRYIHPTGGRRFRHPPSPRSFPFLGHLLWLSSDLIHLNFTKICKHLGSDIIFLRVFGDKIIVLNSAKAASDILEKRSAIYSDRVCPPFARDPTLLDLSDNVAMLGCNDTLRWHRRIFNKWLSIRAVTQFDGLLEHQTTRLLQRLLVQSNYAQPFELVNEEFYLLAYGYQPENKDDKFFQNIQLVLFHIVTSLTPTSFVVNLFPFLTHVPRWFPGTGWKDTAREWREHKEQTYELLYEWTKSQVIAGIAEPSILGYLMQDEDLTAGLSPAEKRSCLNELTMALYAGGTETTSATLMKFVAAMVLNPDIQAKAQKEIDSVIGSDTLPKMTDRNRLPYIQNLVLEVMRWHTVSPAGLPHVCSQDDTYRGYDIEKGTIIMFNTWAMSRDEAIYKDPEQFNPDRFLDPDVPPLSTFGWGRRICPGLHLGESTLFIMIASLLAAFTFSTKKHVDGGEIVPQIKGAPEQSLLLGLQPFEFQFKPRSELYRTLILANSTGTISTPDY